ncbi:MAG: SDR family NAD(P)-dependent oxidoreductase, partial [Desulfobacteraceae bacterium]
SDLGIDSIKRVEILSALEERMPDLPKVTPDMMGTLKTLGQITQYLSKPSIPTDATSSQIPAKPHIHVVQTPENHRVERKIIKLVHLEKPKSHSFSIPEGAVIGVAGDRDGLAGELAASLIRKGFGARQFQHRKEISADLHLAGLVLIAPMEANEAFKWAQTFASIQKNAPLRSNAWFATVSAIDGAFGFNDGQISDPFQGGLAGLVKTAAIEWPEVRCLAVDIDPQWNDIPAAANALRDEIFFAQSRERIEIGIGPDGPVGLDLEDVSPEPNGHLDLNPQDVVIVTGGARGVTAAAAQTLVSQTPCTLVLIGRSPAPQPEPPWLAGLTDEGEIKRGILDNWTEGDTPAPKKIEKRYRQWMANRQVLTTLNNLERMGATARYFSADIRDEQAIASLLERIRGTVGEIGAIVHGAGVLEDRLIVDKQADQFDTVYETKVEGIKSLLNATVEDDLKYMVFFSSVSARQGNPGQADYAMANEVLNKIAQQQHAIRPECKVVSINWGPWNGGMVTPSLKRNFLKHDIALIPLDLGAQAMVDEMAQPLKGPVEVVIGGALLGRVNRPSAAPKPAELTLTCKRDVSLERYPVLVSHQLDGRPVVPLALITEWLAHSALHAHPGLVLHGMDNLRLLNGITLDQQSRLIHMMAGKATRKGQIFEVDVEIREDRLEGPARAHSSAKAILSERLPAPPVFQGNGHFKPTTSMDSLEDIYERVLFHGRDLRGIKEIVRISNEGMSAILASAPPPAQWINDPLRSRWLADPLILDSAFQMAIVWCHKHHGLVCLPSYAASYRQYCRRFPENGVTAILEIHKCRNRKMIGDFTFLDSGKKVVAQLKGYEAIMDPGLINAFKAA